MLKLTFHGGAGDVTGANHLLEWIPSDSAGRSVKILVDCGMFQGSRVCENKNWEDFPYDPKTIDALFVTHGHLDHIGRIPKLVRNGFKGKIFSTAPTRDFSQLMLIDSMGVLGKEAARDKKKPLYEEKDVEKSLQLWEEMDYNKEFEFGGMKIVLRDAGHVLGSAMFEIKVDGKKIVFTGDLGNPPTPILNETYKLAQADYLIMESTYGDKIHEDRDQRKLKLERVIEDTVKRKGVLMIPAFSLERTQELLFEINDLMEHERIPKIPVFLDSPLAIRATNIYKNYKKYFNKETQYIIKSGDDIFNFPGFRHTLTTEESKKINEVPPPKIVIAGSGMSIGGRIIHHEKRYLPDPRSTLLLMCYQAAGSLGRQVEEGAKMVKILGDDVLVRARVEVIFGYSSHPDMDKLFDFVERITGLKKVFVVQGEPRSASFFSQRVRDYLGVDTTAPDADSSFILE